MKLLLYSILIVLVSSHAGSIAQTTKPRDCGTRSPVQPILIDSVGLSRLQIQATFPILMQVFVHVVADDDGTSAAADDLSIARQLENMRQFFAPHNICFILAGKQQINSLDLNAMNVMTEESELNPFLIPNVINLFIHKTLMDTNANLNGFAYAIPGAKLSLVDNVIASVTNRSTTAHEMGHCFGLYHTHETFGGTRVENVPRSGNCSNCTVNGDALCDTEADPDLDNGNVVDSICNYTGTARDGCNNPFTPNPRNIMAYGNRNCRDFFTNEQGARSRIIIQLTPALYNTIAGEEHFALTDQTISIGRRFLLARNLVRINTLHYTVNGSAKVDMSAYRVELKPGIKLAPGADGYVKIRANTLCQ